MRFEFVKQKQVTARALLVTERLLRAIKENDSNVLPSEILPYIGTLIKASTSLDKDPIVVVRDSEAAGVGDYIVIDERGIFHCKSKIEYEGQYEKI
jgi:hypothetical protein